MITISIKFTIWYVLYSPMVHLNQTVGKEDNCMLSHCGKIFYQNSVFFTLIIRFIHMKNKSSYPQLIAQFFLQTFDCSQI